MKTTTLLLCLTFVGCDARITASVNHGEDKESQRFSGQYLSGIKCTHIIDHQTGKEYLRGSQGGFVEVEPTKKP